MSAVCTLSSKCLPPDQLRAAAGELLKPVLELLQAVLQQEPQWHGGGVSPPPGSRTR